jgi:poly-gamma-glutamate synthesis protein (capsule biosynthesis protein)
VAPGGGAAAQVHQPDDLEALMVTAHFENGKLVEARLYPADLGIEHRPTSKMGNPSTPTAVIAKRILEKVQTISKPFGTTIAIENGVGVIRVPTSNTQ